MVLEARLCAVRPARFWLLVRGVSQSCCPSPLREKDTSSGVEIGVEAQTAGSCKMRHLNYLRIPHSPYPPPPIPFRPPPILGSKWTPLSLLGVTVALWLVRCMDSGSNGPGSSSGRGIALCSSGQDTLLSQCLSSPRCINGYRRIYCMRCTWPCDGLRVTLWCHRNRDKIRPDGPFGSAPGCHYHS